jgi:predicted transcriptional regulator
MALEKYEDDKQGLNLDTLLEILGNPTRRVILAKLTKVPHSISELARELGISRQAVHSQMKILSDYNLIENIDPNERSGKYKIKTDLSLRIDISLDYYGVDYSINEIKADSKSVGLKDIGCSTNYDRIKVPEKKIKFLAEQIKDLEVHINELEYERSDLLQKKQCFISELKIVMEDKYKNKIQKIIEKRHLKPKNIRENMNLIEEIFYTLFFNPDKYYKKVEVDSLIDDLFFSDIDPIERAQNRISIEPLLKDLSNLMGFFKEDEDFWFFDF